MTYYRVDWTEVEDVTEDVNANGVYAVDRGAHEEKEAIMDGQWTDSEDYYLTTDRVVAELICRAMQAGYRHGQSDARADVRRRLGL